MEALEELLVDEPGRRDELASRECALQGAYFWYVGGMITATLVLLMATMLTQGAWGFVLVGVALAATSVRAARYPTLVRLAVVAANLIAIPLIARSL